MKSQTHLVKRGSKYYFRARVPADLVTQYGKNEIYFSLRTSDKAEALQRVRIEQLKLDQEFHQRRSLLSASPAELSDIEIERLAALWLSHLLEEDEELRMEGLSPRQFDKQVETVDIVESAYSFELARGILPDEDFEMQDFVESHGIKVQQGSDTYRRLSWAFLKASRKSIELIKARNRGEVVDTPKADPFIARTLPPTATHQTLDSLVTYWKTQADRKPRTVMEVETVVSRFIEVNENLPATTIKKSHVVAFKDRMLEDGKSVATVRKYLGLLSAVFETAVSNDKPPVNPVRGIKLAKAKTAQKSRIPFDSSDLKLIFTSEVFTLGQRPRGGKGEAAFWIPLIALWSGARLEEIGQLLVSDISQDKGIHYFHIIDDESGDKSVKTSSSRRKVPIHNELIKYGFLDYVIQMKTEKQKRLFPLLSSGKGRQLTASWSQWFGRYLRETVGIKDDRKVFHSFRHGFKDACRECDIPKEIHDRLTGHASGDVGDSYGGENFPLEPLAKAISKLRYKELDLSHLIKK